MRRRNPQAIRAPARGSGHTVIITTTPDDTIAGKKRDGHLAISFRRACGPSLPRLDGAFFGVDIAIDYLEIRQTPKIEQLRPRQITVFAPHSK
jgi:hypothetical protein